MVRVLLVDDDEVVRFSMSRVLALHKFDVTVASGVPEALRRISTEQYDVLLSDLHMPGAGDGLTLISAMRHANPQAVTLLLSGYPDVDAASHAILMQADEILVKPVSIPVLIDVIKQRLESSVERRVPKAQSVATVLERSAEVTIQAWLERVQHDELLTVVPMTDESRSAHLPQMFRELVFRLRAAKPLGSRELGSVSAGEHGVTRRQQGYSAAMMVEESRMLQVSIFQTLQNNLAFLDFSVLLLEVMTIADEVDAQLVQAMASYKAEAMADVMPA